MPGFYFTIFIKFNFKNDRDKEQICNYSKKSKGIKETTILIEHKQKKCHFGHFVMTGTKLSRNKIFKKIIYFINELSKLFNHLKNSVDLYLLVTSNIYNLS